MSLRDIHHAAQAGNSLSQDLNRWTTKSGHVHNQATHDKSKAILPCGGKLTEIIPHMNHQPRVRLSNNGHSIGILPSVVDSAKGS